MSEKVHEAIKEIDEFKKKIYERSSNMSSTNKTTNYELSQFVETDKPGWLTDYNSDMRIIDSNLKSVSDVASGASGSLSALTDRVTAAEGAITTNANDIDALEARADVLEAQAQSMSGTIANIQTEQITQNAGIEAATELGYNLARPYDSASTYAVGDYVLFQNTLYKCITAVPVGEAFVPAKWLAIKATDEISAGGYTLPIASASQLGGVKVGSNLSIDAVTGVLNASSSASHFYDFLRLTNPRITDSRNVVTITGTPDVISYLYEINGIKFFAFHIGVYLTNFSAYNHNITITFDYTFNGNASALKPTSSTFEGYAQIANLLTSDEFAAHFYNLHTIAIDDSTITISFNCISTAITCNFEGLFVYV